MAAFSVYQNYDLNSKIAYSHQRFLIAIKITQRQSSQRQAKTAANTHWPKVKTVPTESIFTIGDINHEKKISPTIALPTVTANMRLSNILLVLFFSE